MKDYMIALVVGCMIGFAGTLVFNLLINFFPSLKPSSISAVALILNMESYGVVHCLFMRIGPGSGGIFVSGVAVEFSRLGI